MDEQAKRFVNDWVETIKSDLANLTLVVNNFDYHVNTNRKSLAEKKEEEIAKEIKKHCCSSTTVAGSPEYFWVDGSVQYGVYELYRRSYSSGCLQNILVETVLRSSKSKNFWDCLKKTFPHEYNNPFRAIAMVNVVLIPPKANIEYKKFNSDDIQSISLQRQSISDEFEALTSKL